MYVLLTYRHVQKTRTITYKFTLFKRLPYATERVYQLEVTQTARRMLDTHKLSHEHIGDFRRLGHASWASWEYHDVLAHFCTATNLTFNPVPMHPEDFQLMADQ